MKKIFLSFLLLIGLSACSASSSEETVAEANEEQNSEASEKTRKIANDFENTQKLNTVVNATGDFQVNVPVEWVDKDPFFYTTRNSETRSVFYLTQSDDTGFSFTDLDEVLSAFCGGITEEKVPVEERLINGIKTKYVEFPGIVSEASGVIYAYCFIDNNDANVCMLTFFSNDADSADHSKDFESIAKTCKLLTPETVVVSTPEPDIGTTPEPEENVTMGMKNALASALSYLRYSAFSHDGLIGQLEYEGYSTDEATYAADNCGANWDEQALASAKDYLRYSAFSYTGLIEQLEYEKFTKSQATYGADNCGADWNEQAAKSAESYLKYSSFSRSGLIDQLIFEGFTQAQAEYGVSANGY